MMPVCTLKDADSLSDIFCFKPELKIPGINTIAAEPVTVEGAIHLEGSNLAVPSFAISQKNNAIVSANGYISDIFNLHNGTCDLKAEISEIDGAWLTRVLTELAPQISVPGLKSLALEATISDSLSTPDFSIKLLSDIGKIDVGGKLDFNHDKFSVKSVSEILSWVKFLAINP